MFQVGPFESRLKFPVCKLIDRLDTDCRGKTCVVVSQLADVCGTLPQHDEDRVYGLPPASLEKAAKALLRFHSFDDLHAWLDRHAAADA